MISQRINISSNAPWEDRVGYSRAVRIGNHIFVSGTTAFNNDGKIIDIDDVYKQTIQCIENIKIPLQNAGASLADITRVRIYTVNIDQWDMIGEAFNKFFHDIKPAATMVEVNRLIVPEALVEIEADAYVH